MVVGLMGKWGKVGLTGGRGRGMESRRRGKWDSQEEEYRETPNKARCRLQTLQVHDRGRPPRLGDT